MATSASVSVSTNLSVQELGVVFDQLSLRYSVMIEQKKGYFIGENACYECKLADNCLLVEFHSSDKITQLENERRPLLRKYNVMIRKILMHTDPVPEVEEKSYKLSFQNNDFVKYQSNLISRSEKEGVAPTDDLIKATLAPARSLKADVISLGSKIDDVDTKIAEARTKKNTSAADLEDKILQFPQMTKKNFDLMVPTFVKNQLKAAQKWLADIKLSLLEEHQATSSLRQKKTTLFKTESLKLLSSNEQVFHNLLSILDKDELLKLIDGFLSSKTQSAWLVTYILNLVETEVIVCHSGLPTNETVQKALNIASSLSGTHLIDLIEKLWEKNERVTGAIVQCSRVDLNSPKLEPLGEEMIKEIKSNAFYIEYEDRGKIPSKLRQI